MHRAAWGGIVWVVMVAIGASSARADTVLGAAVSAGAGFTDNALSAPTDATQMPGLVAAPASDFFATVNPSITAVIDQPRFVATFTLIGSLQTYFDQSDANSESARIAGILSWQSSPTWGFTSELNALIGKQASVDPTSVVGVVPSGGGTYAQVAASAGVFHDFTAIWRGSDALRLTLYQPLGGGNGNDAQPHTISIENQIGAQFSVKRDAFGLTLGTTLSTYESGDLAALPTGFTTIVSLQGTWLHELSPFWNFSLTGGASVIVADAGVGATPVARTAFTYRRELAEVVLAAQQTAVSDATAGLSDFRSEATVQLALILSDRFAVRLMGGGAHDKVFAESFDVFSARAEAGVRFKARDNLDFDLAYAFLFQKPTDPTPLVPELIRNTVTLSVRGFYPDRRQRALPFLQQGLRVRESEEVERAEVEAH